MTNKFRGVMQSPVTPLKDDFSLDLATFEKVLDFHVRTGATAISWPHHKGESLNLTIAERKLFAEAAVKTVAGRIPVTIHVSALAVEDTFALARHAQEIGADGILAITPYFWTPTREAIYDYFVRLCGAVELQFLEISRAALRLRPDFALVTGVEFLLPSVPLGGVGSYSAAGSICPNLCRDLFDACVAGDWVRARELQYRVSRLWALFRDQYPSSLKGGMVVMGRPVGPTRLPLPTAGVERQATIRTELERLGILDTEPHGW